MNTGQVAAGFDNGLVDGAPIACALHPDCARPRKQAQAPRARQFSTWCADRQAKAAVDIEAAGTALGLDFYEFSFVDFSARSGRKLDAGVAVREMATDGAGFAGFAAWLDQDPSSGDVLAMPDASTLTQLPWNLRVGYPRDLVWQGDYLDHAPRNALRAMVRKLGDRGSYEDRRRVRVFLFDPATGAMRRRPRRVEQAVLRPHGAHAALRRHRRGHDGHGSAGLGPVPSRPRRRERPVRDQLGL